jgi:hypothetical protein
LERREVNDGCCEGELEGDASEQERVAEDAWVPAGVEEDVEEAGHLQRGSNQAEQEPGAQQHRRLDHSLRA